MFQATARSVVQKSQRWTAFIISLPDAHKRRRRLLESLSMSDIDVEFIDAIDGRRGLSCSQHAEIDFDKMVAVLGRRMTDAECACSLSHLRIYERIIERKLPGAIVLEDDTIWTEQATKCIKAIKPGDVDFLQLDYGVAAVWRFLPAIKLHSAEIKMCRLAKNAPLANCYVLSNRAALGLASNARPIFLPADWPKCLTALKPRICVPRVCGHSNEGVESSTLEPGRRLARNHPEPVVGTRQKQAHNARRNPEPRMPRVLRKLLIRRVPKPAERSVRGQSSASTSTSNSTVAERFA